jgi:hypothetical protein
MLGVGLIMAALAAVMGLIDVLGDVQIRNLSDAWLHASGNGVAVVIELYNRYSRYEYGSAAVIPTRPDLVACRSSNLGVHGLEGVGDGLSSPRRCGRSVACKITISMAAPHSALRQENRTPWHLGRAISAC